MGLGIAMVAVRWLERGMIFFPARYPAGIWDPVRLGVEVEDVWFRSADGLLLHAWWFAAADLPSHAGGGERGPAAGTHVGAPAVPGDPDPERGAPRLPGDPSAEPVVDANPVILWAHGNGGNLTGRAPDAQVLADAGVSVLVFDYRGYGRSEGAPSEAGIYLDAEAAYGYLTKERAIDPRRIVLMGRSIGAAPAARLATRVPHAGLILVSPPPSAKRMARAMFGGLPVDLLGNSRFPVVEWVAQRQTPLLVVHGERDEVIPFAFGREVYEAAAPPKSFVALPGAGHNDISAVAGSPYIEALVAFCREAVVGANRLLH
jgi:hypothetical protein